MDAAPGLGLTLAGHRYLTEYALAALRLDHTLDDREKSRRITALITAANTEAVELLRQHHRLGPVGLTRTATDQPIGDRSPIRLSDIATSRALLRYR